MSEENTTVPPEDMSSEQLVEETISQENPKPIETGVEQPEDTSPNDTADSHPMVTSDTLNTIQANFDTIMKTLDGLNRKFDNRLAQDTSKERIIDSMHEELQTHRQDVGFKLMLPLVRSLISVHDDLIDMTRVALSDPPTDAEIDMQRAFADIADIFRSRLEEHGFESFQHDSDTFDPKFQKPVKRVGTTDPDQDKTIADRIRVGFRYGDRVIRHEIVAVYRLEK